MRLQNITLIVIIYVGFGSEICSVRMRLIQTTEKFTDVSAVLYVLSDTSWMNVDMRDGAC